MKRNIAILALALFAAAANAAEKSPTPTAAAKPAVRQPAPPVQAATVQAAPVHAAAIQAASAPAAAAQAARVPAATVPAESSAVFGDPSLPSTLRDNTYFYQSFGTMDPFRSLLSGDFEPKLQELVDLHTVKMVGVLWAPGDIAAILQDAQGFGYTLRPGDVVKNGSVVSVTQDALVARLNIFGQTTQLTLRLHHEE